MNEQPTHFVKTKKGEALKKWLNLTAWIVVVLATAVVICIKKSGINPETIAFIEFCWQVVIAILGLLLVYLQAKEMAHNTESTLEWNMRIESLKIASNRFLFVASFDAISKYRADEWKKQVESNEAKKKQMELLEKIPVGLDESKDADLIGHIKNIANYFEDVATGIKHGVYDEDILYDSMRGMLVRYYNCFDDFLSEMRDKLKNSRAWVEFRDLAIAWEERFKDEENQTRTKGKPPVFRKSRSH